MAEIISRSRVEEIVDYSRNFELRNLPGAGFTFPSDAQGNVNLAAMPAVAIENYEKCLSGEHDVIDSGVRESYRRIRHPAVLRCDCGNKVWLSDPMTNECDRCGRLYNWRGQGLRPRAQWEEHESDDYLDGFYRR